MKPPVMPKRKPFTLTGRQIGEILIQDGWNKEVFSGDSRRWFCADKNYIILSPTFVQRKFHPWWARDLSRRLDIPFRKIYKLGASDCDNFAEDFHSNIQLTSRKAGFGSAVASWFFWYPSKIGLHAIDGYITVENANKISNKDFLINWRQLSKPKYIEPQTGKNICVTKEEKRLYLGVL